ncbi:MAG TPA: cobalamin B12-binding domain-containing protein [Thermoanaerobaculia bacterium]|nr:cobalamin B12-binding domain-containing protein [Thermoanaerobaculia bacterium]
MATGRPRVVTSRKGGPDFGDLSGPFLLALLAGDEAAAEGLVSRSRSLGADTALVVRDLVMPALCEIGRMWTRGEASIAEEHLATALVSRVLSRSSGGAAISPGPARRIVFACLAGEFHDLGIRFLADVARECGWDAESLGANVPREALVRFVEQRPPAALALSVSLAGHIPEAAQAIAEVRAVVPGITILVGGLAFREDPERFALTGADVGITDAVTLRDWLRAQDEKVTGASPNGMSARGLPETMPASLRRRVARPR